MADVARWRRDVDRCWCDPRRTVRSGIYLSACFELRLAVRRAIVRVFLLLAALEGMVLVIVWLIPDTPRGITAPKMVVIPILFIIVAAVALRLTANQRRILALSGR